MRHYQYNPDYNFVKASVDFNKYINRGFFRYCLVANMYMLCCLKIILLINQAINKGKLRTVALGVHYEEPIPQEYQFAKLDNVLRRI